MQKRTVPIDIELVNEVVRDKEIYEQYLIGLQYRAKTQSEKFGLSYSRYKAILNEQKKLHRKRLK